MVSLMVVEFGFFLVSGALFLFRTVKYVGNRKHGDDCDYLMAATEIDGSQQHLTERRLKWKFCHFST
jgi:hypothetical protein